MLESTQHDFKCDNSRSLKRRHGELCWDIILCLKYKMQRLPWYLHVRHTFCSFTSTQGMRPRMRHVRGNCSCVLNDCTLHPRTRSVSQSIPSARFLLSFFRAPLIDEPLVSRHDRCLPSRCPCTRPSKNQETINPKSPAVNSTKTRCVLFPDILGGRLVFPA